MRIMRQLSPVITDKVQTCASWSC